MDEDEMDAFIEELGDMDPIDEDDEYSWLDEYEEE